MNHTVKRLLSLVLCCALLGTTIPQAAFATEQAQDSGQMEKAPQTGGDKCICETFCTEEAVNRDCPVCGVDAANCGGEAPVDEETAAVQTQIDALPSVEDLEAMPAEEQQAAYMEIQAAHDAYQALTAEQQAQITGADALESLLAYFTELAEPLQDNTGHFVVNDEELTVDAETDGYRFEASSNTLTIKSNTPMTISGGTESAPITGQIVVTASDANLTLAGLFLQAPVDESALVAEGSTGTLTLTLAAGSKSLLRGGNSEGDDTLAGAGISLNSSLLIQCGAHSSNTSSCLTATNCGALTACGGAGETGIGIDVDGNVTVNGGRVSARGGDAADKNEAGGPGLYATDVNIKNAVVSAIGGAGMSAATDGAGLDASGNVSIIASHVTAMIGRGGEHTGSYDGTRGLKGATIKIGGGSVVFATDVESVGGPDYGAWKDTAHGVVFDRGEGAVYDGGGASTVSPAMGFTIPENHTLTVPSGVTLDLTNVTVQNDGAIALEGGSVQGTVSGNQPEQVAGYFIVTGGEYGTHYTYDKDSFLLTILNDANLTISMKPGVDSITDLIVLDVSATATLTLGGLNLEERMELQSGQHLTLNLSQGTNNVFNEGIRVPTGASLTIKCAAHSDGVCSESCGNLKAFGRFENMPSYGNAAIGGNCEENCGVVQIDGGVVEAKHGDNSADTGLAGIGGGYNGGGGTITINGGRVTAVGGEDAAGIGGGKHGAGGTITINGGEVTANGGEFAAGIGGGKHGAGGTITIADGNVKAEGGYGGAGIGGGDWGTGGRITISGGTVEAKSTDGAGAGIGSGAFADGGTVIITGGTVTATGSFHESGTSGSFAFGAGIGGGGRNDVSNTGGVCGTVVILGGKVNAAGGSNGTHSAEAIGPGCYVKDGNPTEGDKGTGIKPVSGESNTYEVWGNLELPNPPSEYTIPQGATLRIPENAKLTIPDGVTLINRGTIVNSGTLANTGTLVATYKVEHYQQNLNNDGYTLYETENLTGQADTSASAVAKSYAGFTKKDGLSNELGTIAADGSLVLKVYYDRNSHKVSYAYTGTVPANASALPAEAAYKFGAAVTVAAPATADGYTFSGWSRSNFTMPDEDVTIEGHFTAEPPSSPPSGGGSSYTPQSDYTTSAASISRTTSRSDLNWLIRNGRTLTLKCGGAEMSFRPEALQAIMDALPRSGGATFAAAPFTGTLPNGARTAYDFTLTGSGNKPLEVTFPAGSVSIGVAYTPKTGEDAMNLYLAYVGGNKLERVQGSAYKGGTVSGDVAHFSTYAVAYEEPVQPWVNPFTDVSEGEWYYESVKFVHQNGLMTGTSDATFSPGQTTSRAMIATILWRQAGSPVVNYAMRFDDVDASAWYGEAVRWAASEGIVSGYGNGSFGPNDPITREQLAVMLYNYEKKRGGDVSTADLSGYTDAGQVSDWALDALRWAVSEGIITGTSSTTLSPQGQATRAQAAVMLTRFCKRFSL